MPQSISVSDLSKAYKNVKAVDSLTFHVDKGEIFGLLGPNGAGKSTVLRILCTLLLPTSGKVEVNGYDVVGDSRKVRSSLGVVLESERFSYWMLSAEDNLRRTARLYYMDSHEASNRIHELLARMGLLDVRKRVVASLSKGMRQKLAITQALLPDPPILLFDEPWSGLDPEAKIEMRNLIAEVGKEEKKTVFLCSHDLLLVQDVCDRIVIMNEGKKVVEGAPNELVKALKGRERILVEVEQVDRQQLELINDIEGVVSIRLIPNKTIHLVTEDATGVIAKLHDVVPRRKFCNVSFRDLSLEDVYFNCIGEKADEVYS